MDLVKIIAVAQDVIGFVMMICSGLIGISMLIPGEHPEKELQAFVEFIKKFSRK